MGATLEALQKLQEVQTQIAAIRAREEAYRRRIRAQKRALGAQDAIIAEKDAEIRQQKLEIGRLDLDVKTRAELLAKHREALNRAKSNKEYAAILTTINTEKADSAKLENRQLHILSELEQRQSAGDALRGEREKIAARLAAAEHDLEQYLHEIAGRIGRLEGELESASEDVPRDALETFWRVAEKHEGEALAPVAVLNAKREEYLCSGCNMSITLETVSSLQTRDDIQTCPSCGRILCFPSSGVARGARC